LIFHSTTQQQLVVPTATATAKQKKSTNLTVHIKRVIHKSLNMARNKAESNKKDAINEDLLNQFEREHTPINLLVSTNNKFDINTAYSWNASRELNQESSTKHFSDMKIHCQ
jgi:hypothetical protein